MEVNTKLLDYNKAYDDIQGNILHSLDTWSKLRKHQENKIRSHYSHIFKNESKSVAKQGLKISSSIGKLSKTLKKQGFKIPIKKVTLKTISNKLITTESTTIT